MAQVWSARRPRAGETRGTTRTTHRLLGALVPVLLCGPFAGAPARATHSASAWFLDPETAEPTPLVLGGALYCSCPDGEGGIFVGGSFSDIGGVPRRNAAHIRADGSISAWDPSPDLPVTAIALHDSTVYVGGTFATIAGVPRTRAAAVHSRTGVATPWAPSANAQIQAFARIGDRVFMGGGFNIVNGVSRNCWAALDATTAALLPFNPPNNSPVYAFAVRDTELFVGGEMGLLALSPTTGALTRTLPQANSWVGALAVAGDDLYVGGGFSRLGPFGVGSRVGLGAIDLRTNSLSPWDPRGGSIRGLVVTPDHVYACGTLAFPGGGNRSGVVRLSRSTARSAGWASPPSPNGEVYTLQLGAMGLLVGAWYVNPDPGPGVFPRPEPRYPEIGGPVFASVASGDTLYVGGVFSLATAPPGASVPYVQRSNLAAIRISTGELLDWQPAVNGAVRALAVHGGTIVAGGAFTSAWSIPNSPYGPHSGVVVIDRFTGALAPWDAGISVQPYGLGDEVRGVLVGDDTLYVVGRFSQVAGQTRRNACAFDLRTGAMTAWNPDFQLGSHPICLVRDGGRILVGGGSQYVGGVLQPALAAVDGVTGALGPWRPSVLGEIRGMVVQGRTLYLAGDIGRAEGKLRGHGAAYSLDADTLLPWNPRAPLHCQAIGPAGIGLLLAWQATYQDHLASPAVKWVDAVLGDELEPFPVYTSDRIWSITEAGGMLFLGGAFTAINGTTEYGWFAAIRSPDLQVSSENPERPGSDALTLGTLRPNPNRGVFELGWSVASPGPVELEVLDVSGRRVHLQREVRSSGSQRTRVQLHRTLPAGLYLLRLRTPAGERVARFLVLH